MTMTSRETPRPLDPTYRGQRRAGADLPESRERGHSHIPSVECRPEDCTGHPHWQAIRVGDQPTMTLRLGDLDLTGTPLEVPVDNADVVLARWRTHRFVEHPKDAQRWTCSCGEWASSYPTDYYLQALRLHQEHAVRAALSGAHPVPAPAPTATENRTTRSCPGCNTGGVLPHEYGCVHYRRGDLS